MIRHCNGYRFQDNSVQGFIGYAFSGYAAEGAATAKIVQACEDRGELFDAGRVLSKPKQCKPDEMERLKADWRAIRKAIKDKGGSIY
jgi:hypothetical protein